MTLQITPLLTTDRERWDVLARGYKTFYKTEESAAQYDTSWQRLLRGDEVHGLGARMLYDKVARFQGFIRYDHPL